MSEVDMTGKPMGWWSSSVSGCPICGDESKVVPKEGHVLSSFWKLRHHDKEELRYCVNGCLDGENARDVIKRLREELRALKEE